MVPEWRQYSPDTSPFVQNRNVTKCVDHQDGTPEASLGAAEANLLSLCVSSSAQLLLLVITPSGAQLEV